MRVLKWVGIVLGAILPPMPIAYTSQLNNDEIESLYNHLKSAPPKAFGGH